jgi:hypothetical protein
MRYGIDPAALLALARRGFRGGEHQLVGTAALRSQTMSLLYADVRAGGTPESEVGPLLDAITVIKVRLLGDRVSRGTAWRLALELGLDDVGPAEHLAVARLQADALVALDPELLRLAAGMIETAPLEAVLAPA